MHLNYAETLKTFRVQVGAWLRGSDRDENKSALALLFPCCCLISFEWTFQAVGEGSERRLRALPCSAGDSGIALMSN